MGSEMCIRDRPIPVQWLWFLHFTQGAIVKLDEIARLAGVSRTTASYVINGKAKQYRVSDKTVEKVMAVVREHNYHPNAVAAGLRAGRTRSIGLVIPDLENTSYTRIANYLERQARQRGYQLPVSYTHLTLPTILLV